MLTRFGLSWQVLEELGLLHNGKIEREMCMKRDIEPRFEHQVDPRRMILAGGRKIHRYPSFYWRSWWPEDMKRLPKNFGSGQFHGNFIPQIPIMAVKRFTRQGDRVLDLFAGSGTTLDVCELLRRRCSGVDLHPSRSDIEEGDARTFRPEEKADLVVLHPPYANGIRFSDDAEDLSKEPERFLAMFDEVVQNVNQCCRQRAHLLLVIGDVWAEQRLQPLCAEACLSIGKAGWKLRHSAVKRIGWTKRKQAIWEYRALKGGYGVMDHENILIFRRL